MSRSSWWVQFFAMLFLVPLVGSAAITGAEGRVSTRSDSPVELTEFHYLPFIARFPPVWFVKSASSPIYRENFANAAGCEWLGIAGEVWDPQGNPVAYGEYRVHVWGSGIDERSLVGGAPAYGPAGYEQFLFNAPVVRDYDLQLETAGGRIISPVYSVQTRANCDENLLLFNFLQQR